MNIEFLTERRKFVDAPGLFGGTDMSTADNDFVRMLAGYSLTTAEIIYRLNEISGAIATAVEQQSGAASEIAHNVSEAARGTAAVSENVEGIRKASEHTSTVSTTVLSAADDLAAQASELRRAMDEFLVTLRAA